MKKVLSCLLVMVFLLAGCHAAVPQTEDTQILLSDEQITVNGNGISADTTQAVYSATDIVYYHAGQDFTYGEGGAQDEHDQEEADAHTVVHITKPGKYILSGKLSLGQIAVDLGEEAKEDPNAVVTLVLNNADITCTVAPAIIFYNVYEPFSDVTEETATKDVDTTTAGANVIIADGSTNNINGSYVAKIYKSYELSEDGKEVVDSKKLHKYDGAFYSKMTLNIDGGDNGTGILNINAENEGLDTELHLTINGGIINIYSENDGINTNEDNVSVTTMNGGTLNILCNGGTGEGDGIDSNGWIVINGGTLFAQACSTFGDGGIDADKGTYINGGNVVATCNMLDQLGDGDQTYAVFNFTGSQSKNKTYTLKDAKGNVVQEYATDNLFLYLIIAGDYLTEGDYTFWDGETQLSGVKTEQMQMHGGDAPQMPDGNNPGGMAPSVPNVEDTQIPTGNNPGGMPPVIPGEEGPKMPGGLRPPEDPIGGNGMPGGEPSTTFTITKGGNQFTNVAPAN